MSIAFTADTHVGDQRAIASLSLVAMIIATQVTPPTQAIATPPRCPNPIIR
jgi:hypothetical protein